MNTSCFRVSVLAVLATAALAAVFLPLARSQVHAAPSYVPIGVAASGNSSMAWFHQPSSGRVLACQPTASAGAALSSIQCVDAKLP